jgi:hypothetical protein
LFSIFDQQMENTFSNKIDCNIHYLDKKGLVDLFDEAKLISPNAVYRLIEELMMPPRDLNHSKKVKKNIIWLLEFIHINFNHPTKRAALTVARAKVNGKLLPVGRSIGYMNNIRKQPQLFSLLNIISLATRRNSKSQLVENFYELIFEEWCHPDVAAHEDKVKIENLEPGTRSFFRKSGSDNMYFKVPLLKG